MHTTTIDLKPQSIGLSRLHLSVFDGLFALALLVLTTGLWWRLGQAMDGYEVAMLWACLPAAVALGWWWKPLRGLMLATLGGTFIAWWAYQSQGQGVLELAQTRFVLKYFVSSQSAMMWMALLLVASTWVYWMALLVGHRLPSVGVWATRLAWAGVGMALVGTMVRWYESYLIGADIGHIPVSNLYEVFVLFAWLTTLMYLYQESRFQTRRMGPWVMLVVSAAIGFLIWYSISRNAQSIQPLIPALQSWWMKIHVPANFVGYGGFAMAAMLASARLIVAALAPENRPVQAWRRSLASRLPDRHTLDEAMYRSIAVGFAFFTLATVLGALWAADAWGGYWSWDPKETWALIVWLNYAAWLHLRMVKRLSHPVASWWALMGLLVTSFAFLGVNMFLSGLHSYGTL